MSTRKRYMSDSTSTSATSSPEETQLEACDGSTSAADTSSVASNAALFSFFTIVSRITGFMRTWALAFALGSTLLASSYQVANNLPNMLYEMAVGGILVTSFLPVYVSVKNKLGEREGNEYASNLLSLVCIVLGIVAVLCTIFAPALIYTQSFLSDQEIMSDSIFFFRFFAIQIVFYGVSTIISGLLNASRDYLWSSAAPIFNNVVVTVTFVLYAVVAPSDPDLAKLIIAIGNPLGVFMQMAIQIPALKRNGIRLHFRVDLHDPYLRDTLSIGIPAVIVMVLSMVTTSIYNSAAYVYLDNGPSVISYARLWYTLPYAFLTVPITTTLFTEIANMQTDGDMKKLKETVLSGSKQILFFMIPFALYLIVFAEPLATLLHVGAFTEENIREIAIYLGVLALSLPLYSIGVHMQKTFSALRAMKFYAIMIAAGAVVNVAFVMGMVYLLEYSSLISASPMVGMATIALGQTLYYVVVDGGCFIYLRVRMGQLGLKTLLRSTVIVLFLGCLGAAVGAGISALLDATIVPMNGSIWNALIHILCGGIAALVVTYGLAIRFNVSGVNFLLEVVAKAKKRLTRGTAAN